jgi:hypothetical protein
MLSIGSSDASVGFSDAAEEWIASPSLEGAARLIAFRGENGFRIGPGNFAYGDPTESTDKCAD